MHYRDTVDTGQKNISCRLCKIANFATKYFKSEQYGTLYYSVERLMQHPHLLRHVIFLDI